MGAAYCPELKEEKNSTKTKTTTQNSMKRSVTHVCSCGNGCLKLMKWKKKVNTKPYDHSIIKIFKKIIHHFTVMFALIIVYDKTFASLIRLLVYSTNLSYPRKVKSHPTPFEWWPYRLTLFRENSIFLSQIEIVRAARVYLQNYILQTTEKYHAVIQRRAYNHWCLVLVVNVHSSNTNKNKIENDSLTSWCT